MKLFAVFVCCTLVSYAVASEPNSEPQAVERLEVGSQDNIKTPEGLVDGISTILGNGAQQVIATLNPILGGLQSFSPAGLNFLSLPQGEALQQFVDLRPSDFLQQPFFSQQPLNRPSLRGLSQSPNKDAKFHSSTPISAPTPHIERTAQRQLYPYSSHHHHHGDWGWGGAYYDYYTPHIYGGGYYYDPYRYGGGVHDAGYGNFGAYGGW